MLDETDLPPGMNETVATAGAGSNAYRFPVTLLSKIKLPDEPEDLIRGLLPGRSFVVLYGRP